MKRIKTTVTETDEEYQIEYANKIHEIKQISESGHIVTVCGIGTWSDLHQLFSDKQLTCDGCIEVHEAKQ